jgi:hypothetical protein
VRIEGVSGGLYGAWHNGTVRALRESGLFAEVHSEPERESDVEVLVQVVHRTRPSRGLYVLNSIFSGITILIIPMYVADVYQSVTTFTTAAHATPAAYERTEASNLLMQLLLLPAAPFSGDQAPEIAFDSARAAILDALEERRLY